MFSELVEFLESAMLDNVRVEIMAKDGEMFTGVPSGLDEGDDDLGWFFNDVEGSIYPNIPLKDIIRARRVEAVRYNHLQDAV